MELRSILTLAAAAAITVFHFWASRRSPKRWYLGGIVPALWLGALGLLFWRGAVSLPEDLRMVVLPTLILLLIWAAGQQAAKKRELEKMKARDL